MNGGPQHTYKQSYGLSLSNLVLDTVRLEIYKQVSSFLRPTRVARR